MDAVLEYGLPAVAAIGAGLFAYVVSGGEEEYPRKVNAFYASVANVVFKNISCAG